jgi:hypothetical protein
MVHRQWLYGFKIDQSCHKNDCKGLTHLHCRTFEYLFKAYVFGKFIIDEMFCNQVIVAFGQKMRLMETMPSLGMISRLWPGLPERCALQRLLVDITVVQVRAEKYAEAHESLPANFIRKLNEVGMDMHNHGSAILY